MDKIAVLDFGGQYAHLIANRIRRLGVYTEILEGDVRAADLEPYKAIILSGGPTSVNNPERVDHDPEIFNLGKPILGICYGHQMMAYALGGKVEKGKVREYGHAEVEFVEHDGVLSGLGDNEDVWMSHFDQVVEIPQGFKLMAKSKDCPVVVMADDARKFFGVQFHPEVTHTACGMQILENFVKLSGAARQWDMDQYVEEILAEIKEKVGDKKVFLMISGGVDSTVAYLLLAKALGQERVYGLFVDIGFMRKGEREEVEQALRGAGVTDLHVYDASEEYFTALEGVFEPEQKRKIIGNLFLDVQAKVSEDLGLDPSNWILAQGTIYPDTIESGGTKNAHTIKTHHNRVDRVQKLIEEGKVIEPLHQLYKDEVRKVGEKLGLNEDMVWRHPFPGPGLAVRCLCLEQADWPDGWEQLEADINAVTGELTAKVLPIKSVGVQGDERTYRHPVMLYGKRPSWDELNKLATQLTNQFPQINRVVLLLNKQDIGEVTTRKSYLEKERISLLQDADAIVMNYLREAGIHREIWQSPTVLIPVSLGSQMEESIVLRPIQSQEAMTANFYDMDFEKLDELVGRLDELEGVGAILYDITNKPPGTIEWE